MIDVEAAQIIFLILERSKFQIISKFEKRKSAPGSKSNFFMHKPGRGRGEGWCREGNVRWGGVVVSHLENSLSGTVKLLLNLNNIGHQ